MRDTRGHKKGSQDEITKKQGQFNIQNWEKTLTQAPERFFPSSMKRITVVVTSFANKVADIEAMRAFW
jgi:hypothetical protein